VHDPAVAHFVDKAELPSHVLLELQRFFQDYKALERKQVVVDDLLGPEDAVKIIRDALELYRRLRRGELKKT
jgi:inorganic pyrophosphatase